MPRQQATTWESLDSRVPGGGHTPAAEKRRGGGTQSRHQDQRYGGREIRQKLFLQLAAPAGSVLLWPLSCREMQQHTCSTTRCCKSTQAGRQAT
jgi:hypothetical protein